MARHFGYKNGDDSARRAMKMATRTLFSLIRRRSGMTPAQLEWFFGFEIAEGALHTGQEWRRYEREFLQTQGRQENQATSIERAHWIARKAFANGWLTTAETIQIGVGTSSLPINFDEYRDAISHQAQAKKIFEDGKRRMLEGKMPVSPTSSGGRPRAARSDQESLAGFARWTDQLRNAGFEVVEDRTYLAEVDALVRQELNGRPTNATAGGFLSSWERPFDPSHPHHGAVERLYLCVANHGLPHAPWPLPSTVAELSEISQPPGSVTSADVDLNVCAALSRLDEALNNPSPRRL
ncbi:hypothetical protein [Pandoraea sp. NPDC090278]|uniref:hypothetical protein n=1 Tax=Pandoraea sp. NPDC090278 TaxID=3364391 RepID=UPI00383B65BC